MCGGFRVCESCECLCAGGGGGGGGEGELANYRRGRAVCISISVTCLVYCDSACAVPEWGVVRAPRSRSCVCVSLLRGSREGWARAFLPRLMNRSFFGLLRASLLRPSTPFFGTCFVWQQRGSRRQVASTRSTACARPAGAVTASHWRCDCDRSLCAPESRLWAVWCEERPTGKCRSTCRSSALQR